MGFRDLSNKRTGSSWTDCFAREKLHQRVSGVFGVHHSTPLGHGHQSLLATQIKKQVGAETPRFDPQSILANLSDT
jgi:hypothetical protein